MWSRASSSCKRRLCNSSARLLWVMSASTQTTWVIIPLASRSGVAALITSTAEPSFLKRRCSMPSYSPPCRTVLSIWRNSSSSSLSINKGNFPNASVSLQPKMRSADGFHWITRPSRSNSRIAFVEVRKMKRLYSSDARRRSYKPRTRASNSTFSMGLKINSSMLFQRCRVAMPTSRREATKRNGRKAGSSACFLACNCGPSRSSATPSTMPTSKSPASASSDGCAITS